MLRLTVLAAIFGSFLFGAVAGALMFHYWAAMSMALPIAGLCLLILLDAYRPISDVRQLDLLSDPELGMHGIIHSLLPPNLGIYRMATHQHGRLHAPNFQRWAQRLRPQWKVIILALNRQLRFDGNAITDLQAAIALLTESGRKLILCGISTNQFKTLDRHGVTELLGVENICVDLEFAIARGIDLAAGIADLPIGSF